MRTIIAGRTSEQVESFGAIEEPDDEEVREAFDVGEPGFELRQDFEHTFGLVLRSQSLGNLSGLLVGTSHTPNRPR